MSEAWRRKRYYKPRVLIDTERVLNSEFDDIFVCITGAQVEMLRNLMQYLHRRSTFVSAYANDHYLCANNDDWDNIQSIVAELENVLMGCEDIVAQLKAIARAVAGITAASTTTPAMVEAFVTDEALQYENPYNDATFTGDEDICSVAQLTWNFAYETITEVFQPIQDAASDAMLPIAMVAFASWIGTPILGIPVGLMLAVIWAFIEAWEAGSLQNVVNSLIAARDDLICAMFNGLQIDARAAYILVIEIVDELPGWSVIDKELGHLLFSTWIMDRMQLAIDNETAWAVNGVMPGACDACYPIIEGNDWYARQVTSTAGTIDFVKVPPVSWVPGCFDFSILADETFCGIVFDVVDEVGDCELAQQDVAGGDCIATTGCWPNRSEVLGEGAYFAVNGDSIDEFQCKSVLAPGATDLADTLERAGPDDLGAGFHFGWNCTGSITVIIKYVVFVGSPP